MRRTFNPLIPLVQTLDDGMEFYRIAEKKTNSRHLKSAFARLAEIREFASAYIIPYIDQHDLDLEKSFTYHGTLANRYAPLLEKVIHDQSLSLVREVEEHLVDAMIDASFNSHNALVECIIKDLIPLISQNFEACLQTQDTDSEANVVAA